MNNEELIDVKTLRPFRRFIYTIGELPSSYLMSMTYEEQLIWLCNYLSQTVIPALNNNGLAVEELQAKYIELKDYVDHYFDNLDVQEEINNKLDEMADSGELTDIIAQYLQLAGVLAYNTLSDLENAENIVNGSICVILGKDTYNDGKTAFYKIRTITSGDVVDGDNIVALDVSDTLIAEKMPNYNINQINKRLNLLEHRKYVFIGDSYDAQVDPSDPTSIKWWSTVIVETLGLTSDDYIRSSNGGASFGNNTNTFNDLITVLDYDETVTDVLIAGGYNDQYYTYEQIGAGAIACNTTIKSKFPNAKIHLGFIGNTTNSTVKVNLKETLQKYIQLSNSLGWHYINNVEYSMQNYASCFLADGVHPSVYGSTLIGRNLAKGLISGSADIQYEEITMTGQSSYADGDGYCDSFAPGSFKCSVKNGITILNSNSQSIFGFLDNISYTPNNVNELVLGTFENGFIRGCGEYTDIPITGYAYNGANYFSIVGSLKFKNGRLYISFLSIGSGGYNTFSNLKTIVVNHFTATLPTEMC